MGRGILCPFTPYMFYKTFILIVNMFQTIPTCNPQNHNRTYRISIKLIFLRDRIAVKNGATEMMTPMLDAIVYVSAIFSNR